MLKRICITNSILTVWGYVSTANNLYFDAQELPDCPLAKQTVHGRIVWRRNPLLTES